MNELELRHRHTYHAPIERQISKFQTIREKALELALLINGLCPESVEKTRALDAIDTVVFNANAAIARHG